MDFNFFHHCSWPLPPPRLPPSPLPPMHLLACHVSRLCSRYAKNDCFSFLVICSLLKNDSPRSSLFSLALLLVRLDDGCVSSLLIVVPVMERTCTWTAAAAAAAASATPVAVASASERPSKAPLPCFCSARDWRPAFSFVIARHERQRAGDDRRGTHTRTRLPCSLAIASVREKEREGEI